MKLFRAIVCVMRKINTDMRKGLYTLVLLLVLLTGITAFKMNTDQGNGKLAKSGKAETIKWLTMEEAEAKIKKEPRKIFVDVYTDWCGWCKKMDKDTFSDPEIAAYVNKHYYAVKLDAEGKKPITVRGHTYTFKPEYKSHELALALLNGQMSYPTTVYLDEQMNMLSPIPGYLDKAMFTKIIRYFGDNHHKTMTWKEYEKKK
jgi:thioredoxin-related protein